VAASRYAALTYALLLATCLASTGLSGCSSEPDRKVVEGEKTFLSGVVSDSASGEAIDDVTVRWSRGEEIQSEKTDRGGHYDLTLGYGTPVTGDLDFTGDAYAPRRIQLPAGATRVSSGADSWILNTRLRRVIPVTDSSR